MRDDKAIEKMAQSDAEFDGRGDLARLSKADRQRYLDRSRAALAAADKVRAEGFDAHAVALELFRKDHHPYWTEQELNRAFAAGLAKGAVERAALAEALEAQSDHWRWIKHAYPNSGASATADRALSVINDALALVRKGV